MKFEIQLVALIFIFLLFILVTYYVKKNKISVKYSIVWYLCLLLLSLFTVFPNLLGYVTNLVGIQVSSNFLFAFMIGVLFIITLSLTIIVSEQQEKIKQLVQEISIIKSNKK